METIVMSIYDATAWYLKIAIIFVSVTDDQCGRVAGSSTIRCHRSDMEYKYRNAARYWSERTHAQEERDGE